MDKTFDPRHLDIKAFAQSQADLQGQTSLTQWPRLFQEQFDAHAQTASSVRWQAHGHMVPLAGGGAQVGLNLTAQATLSMQCQRCLTSVLTTVEAEREFLFVADEATAEALDEESDADVLVISRDFDLLSLVEDELILALPLVPRHADCPDAPPAQAQDETFEAAAAERPNPFAALAALKKAP